MIDNGQTLLVFAERGDPGGPPWYHNMYDWFQETTFSFTNKKQFDCAPNRGKPDAPLFLINHWVTLSPPDPSEGAVNSRAVLDKRIEQCLTESGASSPTSSRSNSPNAETSSPTVQSLNDEQLRESARKPSRRRYRPSRRPRRQHRGA